MRALARFFARHFLRRKLRVFLAVSSIALAVALSISMRVAEVSILRAFEKSAEAVSGKADAFVTRGTGVEIADVRKVEALGRLRAAPVIQDSAVAVDFNEPMLVLGVDFARDVKLRGYKAGAEVDPRVLLLSENAAFVSRSFTNRHGLRLGSAVKLDVRTGLAVFRIAGILEDEGPARALAGKVVVMSVETAARHFGRGTRCDRIEVAFDGATLEELRTHLGPDYRVSPVTKSNQVLDYLLAQQRTVLLGVTVIAALIGAFIVFNSISLSVVERVKEIGVLRAIGATRRQIVGALLLESSLLGVAGAAAGTALGIALARFFVDQAVRQMNVLLYLVDVREVAVPADAYAIALVVGVGTALAGALFPALEASRVPPMVAIRAATYGMSKSYGRNFVAGLLLLAGSFALAWLPGTTPMVTAMAVSFVALALMLPKILLATGGLVRILARRTLRIEGYLAVDSIVKFPARTALTVLAFAGSLSMIVAISGTLLGFQRALDRWFDAIFPFDLTVQRTDLSAGAYGTSTFPESILEETEKDARVERAYGVRVAFSPYGDSTVMLLGIDLDKFTDLQRRRGIEPGVLARKGEGVFLSHNFVRLNGPMEEIRLTTADGPRTFRVLGEIEDYSWPRGVVLLDRSIYRRYWLDDEITYMDIRAREGVDLAQLKTDLVRSLSPRSRVYVYDTKEVRDVSQKLVSDWFRLADAQVFLAIAIGAIGVINTLLISLLARSRQIGLLRAVGATGGQIGKSVALEAAFTGWMSGVLGSAIGLFLVRFPLSAMAERASGYDVPFVVPWTAVLVALASGLLIALAASFFPIRMAKRIDIIDAIGYE